MERAPTLREKIEAFLRVAWNTATRTKSFCGSISPNMASMCATTPISKQLRRLQRDNMRHLASLIEAAVRRREIRPVPAGRLAAKLFDIARGWWNVSFSVGKSFKCETKSNSPPICCGGESPTKARPRREK